ncbi:MAG: sulfite exporter TauE/SafE family protein [Ideonella sp.]|nr:sulfite exporter TauE/SafE family protein [Ideonella sp.]MCC7456761.1 sulfite exporter TauE/SafE family protein [Nitrospira sp.]
MIGEPAFYAVAVPAALLVGIGKSGVAGGFGILAVPLIALVMPVPQAAAIVLPLLTVGDLFGLAALIRDRDRALLRTLLPAGLLGTAAGFALFDVLSPKAVSGFLGVMTLLFLAQRTWSAGAAEARHVPRWFTALAGWLSGVASFVAHAGGPPVSVALLPMRLAPAVFAGTTAVFFTVLNASKWLPYAWLGLIDASNMASALVLAPFAALGVWLGVKVLRRLPALWFYRLVSAGLLITGLKLSWDGFR